MGSKWPTAPGSAYGLIEPFLTDATQRTNVGLTQHVTLENNLLLDKYFECVDEKLFKYVTGLPPRSERQNSKNAAQWETKIDEEIAGHLLARDHLHEHEKVFHVFGVIDQKAGAMLTHISVMIAANALLLSKETGGFLDGFSVLLMCSFIVIALLSLRLLRFWSSFFPGRGARDRPQRQVQTEMNDSFREEIFYRGRLYRFTLNLTTLLTAVSALVMCMYGLELAFNVGWKIHLMVSMVFFAGLGLSIWHVRQAEELESE
ncbi:hypothetical protein K4L04_10035 [Phaeobacter inhibens]|uniref:hypothetical protein n=1 Tax=Phaeobacter inhibens TaxID=221822 RepID=UPI0021A906B1|nr:hypothetical protein [Phaeobacter inhibens]UWR74824.1 hypothetical protein K4L04_10035 [Phaeobacter inhibens]